MTTSDRRKKPVKQLHRLGYVGLGKMGSNMVERLLKKGYDPVVFDLSKDAVNRLASQGAQPSTSLKLLVNSLEPSRLIWIMVPHQSVDHVLDEMTPVLEPGDTIIDGGNSFYKDSIRRASALGYKKINFVDAGVSGGPEGALEGACIMVGGKREVFEACRKLFEDLSVSNGFAYLGKSGAGHFTKMVHNGIEYGMMQSIAEGFAVLKASGFQLNLARIADLYNHGSVVTSSLTGWLKSAFEMCGEDLAEVSGSVAQSGEGKWTADAAKELKIAVPVIEASVNYRIASQREPSYTGRILSALRNQFGKH